MLKIAIVTNNYKPYSGGVVSSIDSFTSVLRALGHKVSIITLDFTNNKNEDEKDIFRINCPVKFIYRNNPIAIPFRPYKSLFSLIKTLSPDIIHSQHPFLLGKLALKVSKKLNIPIIFTYHTRYDQYLHYIPLPKIITKPIVQNLTISYCNAVEGIIAPSESIFNYLQEYNIKKPIQVIPSGILPIFATKLSCEKKINKPFHLLTVSRFVKEKNIFFLLDVFSKLNQEDFIFTLIGYGSELQNLKNYAYKKLGLSEKNLKFIEKPSKEIILSFYESADLFIFSSVTETQGLVLAEAMSSGTPVVALNGTGSCDIVKNGINGFLVSSMNDMIEKIIVISQNQILHKKMQENAFDTSKLYNPNYSGQNLVKFYKKILSAH